MEGNALTMFTVMYVLCIMKVGMYFALENPLHSLMWWYPMLKVVMGFKGVICTHFNMSDYGAFWRKPTCILHNTPLLHLLKLEMDWNLPVVPLRGQIWFQGAMVFLTSLDCAYPSILGE